MMNLRTQNELGHSNYRIASMIIIALMLAKPDATAARPLQEQKVHDALLQ